MKGITERDFYIEYLIKVTDLHEFAQIIIDSLTRVGVKKVDINLVQLAQEFEKAVKRYNERD